MNNQEMREARAERTALALLRQAGEIRAPQAGSLALYRAQVAAEVAAARLRAAVEAADMTPWTPGAEQVLWGATDRERLTEIERYARASDSLGLKTGAILAGGRS